MSEPAPTQPTDQRLYCPKCGYNVTGLPMPQCPECGTGFNRNRLLRESRSGRTQFMGLGPQTLMFFAPVTVALGLWVGLMTESELVAKSFGLSSLLFALIASFVVGRGAARAFAKRGPDNLAVPVTIMMTVLYACLFLVLEIMLMALAFFGACGTACAFGTATHRV